MAGRPMRRVAIVAGAITDFYFEAVLGGGAYGKRF